MLPALRLKYFTRRGFLQVATLGIAGAAIDTFAIEPNRVVITRHVLNDGRSSAASCRFVQLTDLHLHDDPERMKQVTKLVNALKPDFVVFTGDSIDRADRLVSLGQFLDLLDSQTPKYAILGNWEYWSEVNFAQLERTYGERNGCLLINKSAELIHKEHRIVITGLDSQQRGRPSLEKALLGVPPSSNHIVLAHCPIQRDQIATSLQDPASGLSEYSIQCVFAGHTHGGQVTALGLAPYCPPGSGRYVSGWYRDGVPSLYVSRGIGNSVFPGRFCATPEIACFDWNLETQIADEENSAV